MFGTDTHVTPKATDDDTGNPFAEFAAPSQGTRSPSQLLFDWDLTPRRDQSDSVAIQLEIEQHVLQTTCPYAHWWFAWELLRRSPEHWAALHTPVRPSPELVPDWEAKIDELESDTELQKLASAGILPDPKNAQRMVESSLRIGHGASLGRLSGRLSREHAFPPPNDKLEAPDGSAALEKMLRAFFAPLFLPAVILGGAARLGPWRAPTGDYVEIFVHMDGAPGEVVNAVKRILTMRRRDEFERRDRWVLRPNTIWGTFSPSEAMTFLDARAAGVAHRTAIESIHEKRVEAHAAANLPPPGGSMHDDAQETLRINGYDLAKRLLAALRDNPLRPIAHIQAPRKGRRRATES